MSYPYEPEYSIGDEVEVTGDTQGFGHSYSEGLIVKLTRFDKSDNSWMVEPPPEYDCEWVGQRDMKPSLPAPTEQEIAELFGLAPKASETRSIDPSCLREALAEAWEEGYRARAGEGWQSPGADNPYRATPLKEEKS